MDDDGSQQRRHECRRTVHSSATPRLDEQRHPDIGELASTLQRGLAVNIGIPVAGHRPALLAAAQYAAQPVDWITTLREESTRPHHAAIPVERVGHGQRGEYVRVQREVMPTRGCLLPIEYLEEAGSISNRFRSASPVLTPRFFGANTPGSE